MQTEAVRILIVEDQNVVAFGIKKALTLLGYETAGMLTHGEDVLPFLVKNHNSVDLILLDIGLAGTMNGYETAIQVNKSYDIPIIYLTGQLDEESFNKAFSSKFASYMTKPFEATDLGREIKTTLFNYRLAKANKPIQTITLEGKDDSFIEEDYILINKHFAYERVKVKSIFWIKSVKEYCDVKLEDGVYVVREPLKNIIEILNNSANNQFIRIHRSFVINLQYASSLLNQTQEIVMTNQSGKTIGKIPVGRNYKQNFLDRFNKLR